MSKIFKIIFISTSVISFACTEHSKKTHTIDIISDKFVPEHLEINVGDTITWFNKTGDWHTSTSGDNCKADGIWDSGIIENGKQFTHVFQKKGKFPYFCMPHCPHGMKGSITVGDADKPK